MSGPLTFPSGFRWGTATSAYQIEGAVAADGRRPSIWDTFSHTPGKVRDGDTGDVACDHYHRSAADLDLMADLGVDCYRFSIAWPRVIPTGTGAVNQAGLDFYSRLVDDLLDRGIEPFVTLYHWDLPQPLQDAGGWPGRDVVDRFAEFAAVVGRRLGDRVRTFFTINEPWCVAYLGYGNGRHAPGLNDDRLALTAAHHLNLAHARAVAALRATTPAGVEIGVVLNASQVDPANPADPADVAAAELADALANRIFLDPVLRGEYPQVLVDGTAETTDWSFVRDGDLAETQCGMDFLGINYYNPALVAASPPDDAGAGFAPPEGGGDRHWLGTRRVVAVPVPSARHTALGWPVDASGLTRLLLRLTRDYGVPLLITENGCAVDDHVAADGAVHDEFRVDYLRDHLVAVYDALAAGADVRGYFAWSLLDNFEWAEGYAARFGLVHVDFDTQLRTPKDSAAFYRDVVKAGTVEPATP